VQTAEWEKLFFIFYPIRERIPTYPHSNHSHQQTNQERNPNPKSNIGWMDGRLSISLVFEARMHDERQWDETETGKEGNYRKEPPPPLSHPSTAK
jgi:hypothetical protein